MPDKLGVLVKCVEQRQRYFCSRTAVTALYAWRKVRGLVSEADVSGRKQMHQTEQSAFQEARADREVEGWESEGRERSEFVLHSSASTSYLHL